MDPRTVLSALADLAPAGGQRVHDVTEGNAQVAWLTGPDWVARGQAVDRLAALDALRAVHPDGPAAHLERQRTLVRAGWRLVDAFPTRWASDSARAAVDLLATPLHNSPRPLLEPRNLRPATP